MKLIAHLINNFAEINPVIQAAICAIILIGFIIISLIIKT